MRRPQPRALPERYGRREIAQLPKSKPTLVPLGKGICWLYCNWNGWPNKPAGVITNYSGSSTNGTFLFFFYRDFSVVLGHSETPVGERNSFKTKVEKRTATRCCCRIKKESAAASFSFFFKDSKKNWNGEIRVTETIWVTANSLPN